MGKAKVFDIAKARIAKAGYDSTRSKLETMCTKGHTYQVNWANFQSGARCPVCAKK